MTEGEKVSLTISITRACRDQLRTMAAGRNIENPDQVTSASAIAREIIYEYLNAVDATLQRNQHKEDQMNE
ncbi:MAG: hypothetical protein WAL90_13715 [Desulfobacterales bacterium]